MAGIILGNINQDRKRGRLERLHSVGEEVKARDRHIMFFTDVIERDAIDLNLEERQKLKQFGHLIVTVGAIHEHGDAMRIAELQFVDAENASRFAEIAGYVIGDNFKKSADSVPMFLSMPPSSVVETGMEFRVGYLSILEPLGEGLYQFQHDYSIQSSRPRFEVFPEDHKERIPAA